MWPPITKENWSFESLQMRPSPTTNSFSLSKHQFENVFRKFVLHTWRASLSSKLKSKQSNLFLHSWILNYYIIMYDCWLWCLYSCMHIVALFYYWLIRVEAPPPHCHNPLSIDQKVMKSKVILVQALPAPSVPKFMIWSSWNVVASFVVVRSKFKAKKSGSLIRFLLFYVVFLITRWSILTNS